MRFTSAKTHSKKIVVEATPSDGYESDDSEAKHAFDSDSSDEEVATKIRKAFDEACREAEEKGEEPPVMPQEEMSAYAALRLKLAEEKAAKEAELAAKIKAAEASCRDWTEWTCLVCNLQNRRPTHPVREVDVRFGTKGTYYKRTYAIIRESRDAPQCTHCMTYSDYVPPMGSAHWFKYNKKPHDVYTNYPYPVRVQAGLSNNLYSRWARSLWSCLFGVENDSRSKLVFNDWILRQYLNGVFPEPPRQVKPVAELFELGEMVECKLQKGYWTRCRIIAARSNHTYDIKYDSGDELRLVLEEGLFGLIEAARLGGCEALLQLLHGERGLLLLLRLARRHHLESVLHGRRAFLGDLGDQLLALRDGLLAALGGGNALLERLHVCLAARTCETCQRRQRSTPSRAQ
jgi:hypothetical protein